MWRTISLMVHSLTIILVHQWGIPIGLLLLGEEQMLVFPPCWSLKIELAKSPRDVRTDLDRVEKFLPYGEVRPSVWRGWGTGIVCGRRTPAAVTGCC